VVGISCQKGVFQGAESLGLVTTVNNGDNQEKAESEQEYSQNPFKTGLTRV